MKAVAYGWLHHKRGVIFVSKWKTAVLLSAMTLVPVMAVTSTFSGNVHASTSSQHITIKFANWVSAESATAADVNKVIKAFEVLHPNVTVQNVAIPFDSMYQQLTTMAAAGNLPDVDMLSGPWTQELGAVGDLSNLKPLAGQAYLNDNYKGALDAGSYHGTLYSIPSELTPHAFWYNKKLMKEAGLNPNDPPKTLAQLNKDSAIIESKLGSKGIYPLGIDTTKIDYALVEYFPYFYMFNAKPLYNDAGNFNTPQVANSLNWLRMTVQKHWTPTGDQIKVERQLMADNKIVFKLDGPYVKGIMQSLNPALNGKAFYNTFGVTTVPVGANGKSQTLADIHQLGISSHSKNQKLDWEFIKFFASSTTAIKDYEVPVGSIPPLKSFDVKNESGLLSDPVSKEYINHIFPTMMGGPYGPQYAQSGQTVIQALQEAALTNQPISQIQQSTEQQLKAIYGK